MMVVLQNPRLRSLMVSIAIRWITSTSILMLYSRICVLRDFSTIFTG